MEVCSSTEMDAPGASHLGTGDHGPKTDRSRPRSVPVNDGGDTETVRLDPSFVDTQVSLDFIAADLVGFDLELYDVIHGGDESFKERLNASMKDINPCIGLASGADTWFDNPTVIHAKGNKFGLTGDMRLEFVIEATSPRESSCKGMRCENSPSDKRSSGDKKFCHLTALEVFVKENSASIVERFPSVESMKEYSRIIGFLRWARRPGHLAGINLVALAEVPASDPRNRTPDILTEK